ncbi:hypothetical protein C942_01989 [Photobacterium marinum]|uniref:Uncharacterized protein n=1 Tax=Photobacterium marinum TaxID=1056511 RepID=L8JBG8_9GAMM|nr:hypothetical protein [Photobacterium marinum]ELR64899.1 hypothetical protein C942_01989 [Photobacterium marinum]
MIKHWRVGDVSDRLSCQDNQTFKVPVATSTGSIRQDSDQNEVKTATYVVKRDLDEILTVESTQRAA